MGASAGARSPGTAATEAAKLQTAPSPPARPPARQINGRAQPAGPALLPDAGGGHSLGTPCSSDPGGRGTSAPAAERAPPGLLSLFCLLGFCRFPPSKQET